MLQHDYFLPWRRRTLIWQFVRRDVLARYRGSMLGLGWSLLTPLLMLAVYTFVFRSVFNARWGSSAAGEVEFALQVYAGLVVFSFFAEVVTRAPRLILDEPSLVKKVVFPLEVLPWVAVLAALSHALVNLAALLGAALLLGRGPGWSVISLPLVMLPTVVMLTGLAWFLSSLGVYLRDIGQVTSLLVSLLMFLSPVFYPIESVPSRWQPWLAVNPLLPAIEQMRRVTLGGHWPDPALLLQQVLWAAAFAWLGARWFAATRKGFADVV